MRVEGTRTGRMRGNVRVENGVSKETGTRSVQAEDPWRTRRDDDARRVRRVRKEETGSGQAGKVARGRAKTISPSPLSFRTRSPPYWLVRAVCTGHHSIQRRGSAPLHAVNMPAEPKFNHDQPHSTIGEEEHGERSWGFLG